MNFSYREIPDGIAGTDATVEEMNALVRAGLRNPLIRLTALKIIQSGGIAARDFSGEINAVFNWVKRNIRFTKDPYRLEMVHAPDVILQLKAGDCDDVSILLAALLQSLGHRTRFKVIASMDPGTFNHVYTQVFHNGKWLSLDPTVSVSTPGWESPRIYGSKTYELGGVDMNLGQIPKEIDELVEISPNARAGPGTAYISAEDALPHITAFLRADLKDALVMRQVSRGELVKQLEYMMSSRADRELSPVQIRAAITVLSEAIRYIDSNPEYRMDISLSGLAGLEDLGWPIFEKIGGAVKKTVKFITDNVEVEGETPPEKVVITNPPGSPENAPETTVDMKGGSPLTIPLILAGTLLVGAIAIPRLRRK